MFLYDVCKFICWFFFKVFWRLTVYGREHVPATGAIIVAANHRSYADPPLVGVSIPRYVHFMAKKELFAFRPIGWFIGQLNAHPVNRRSSIEAIRVTQELLRSGHPLIVFPEGTRNKTDQLEKPRAGVGLLAKTTTTCIIPTYVHDSSAVAMKRFHRISVVFGAPIDPRPFETYQELADETMHQIQRLKDRFLDGKI